MPSRSRSATSRLQPFAGGSLTHSGIHASRRQVIRDAATWQSVWNEIFSDVSPQPALPAVDFSTQMVLLAAQGDQATGGFGIFIDGAALTLDGTLIVAVTSASPGPGCLNPQQVTQPVDVAVAAQHATAAFTERTGVVPLPVALLPEPALASRAMPFADDIAREELLSLRSRGLLRALEPLRTPPGAGIELRPGERLINFSSNDYLGLAGDARVAEALAQGARIWGAGAGASRLVTGDFAAQHELEAALADFEKTESAVLFGSGYAANCGIISTFAGPEDLILSDALNHASLIDGCRLSRARVEVYPHCDVAAVDRLLGEVPRAAAAGGHRHGLLHGRRPRAAARAVRPLPPPRRAPRARRGACDRRDRSARRRPRRRARPLSRPAHGHALQGFRHRRRVRGRLARRLRPSAEPRPDAGLSRPRCRPRSPAPPWPRCASSPAPKAKSAARG